MQPVQERILDTIEKEIIDRGFNVAISKSASNVGLIYIYKKGKITADGYVRFNFQPGNYNLGINWKNKDIPSQEGRNDYYDFYQQYTEPTNFFEVLNRTLRN